MNISAGNLEYLNKEGRLVYTGDVVAVQGESSLKASRLVIDLRRDATGAPAADPATAPGSSSVTHMEADGPVTLTSKDQVGTGDHGTYDKARNEVMLVGHVTLSQGSSATKGDTLVYDMTTGQAHVRGHVRSVFVPTSKATPGSARTR